MAARDHRLRLARDFQALWRSRWSARSPAMVLRYARRPDSPGRIGIVISRAVSKKATDRNLLKRRLRSILLKHPVPVGVDAAIITQKSASTLTYDQLRQTVATLFRQAFSAPRRQRPHSPVSKNPVA